MHIVTKNNIGGNVGWLVAIAGGFGDFGVFWWFLGVFLMIFDGF